MNLFFKIITFFFLICALICNLFNDFTNGWSFISPLYFNSFWAINYTSLVGLILCAIGLKFHSFRKTAIILTCIISFFIFKLQFNPIDTFEYPHDIKILNQNGNFKTVIRERKSGKTNEIKIDTVKVEDKFIFRRIIIK